MDTQTLTNDAGQFLTELIQQVFPDLPAEVIRYGGATLLAALALMLLLVALRLLRSKPRNAKASRVNVPRSLQQEGVTVDVLNSLEDDDVAVRCVLTSVSSGKIHCEIIERLNTIKASEGKKVMCVFAPMNTDKGKVNSFTSTLLETDTSGKKLDRIILSAPDSYGLSPRRKHTRKRVADQQFIRVKLWVDNPFTSDIPFEDAIPHIGVNSLSAENPIHAANAVINISNGGLGLNIKNQVIPETCAVDAPVTINLFMFNFREKTFKPYWYVGRIRTMEEGRPGFTRMGIEFTGTGTPSASGGDIRWQQYDD